MQAFYEDWYCRPFEVNHVYRTYEIRGRACIMIRLRELKALGSARTYLLNLIHLRSLNTGMLLRDVGVYGTPRIRQFHVHNVPWLPSTDETAPWDDAADGTVWTAGDAADDTGRAAPAERRSDASFPGREGARNAAAACMPLLLGTPVLRDGLRHAPAGQLQRYSSSGLLSEDGRPYGAAAAAADNRRRDQYGRKSTGALPPVRQCIYMESATHDVYTTLCLTAAGQVYAAALVQPEWKAVLVGLSVPTDQLLTLDVHSTRVATADLPFGEA